MYNESFIKTVERVYGKDSETAKLARNGHEILGRWLDDSQVTFSYNDILNNSYERLREIAFAAKEKADLYRIWRSGRAYAQESLRERYCPLNYLQNSGADNRYTMEKVICKGTGYVGYFPDCKMWGCKAECWRKYDELKGET